MEKREAVLGGWISQLVRIVPTPDLGGPDPALVMTHRKNDRHKGPSFVV